MWPVRRRRLGRAGVLVCVLSVVMVLVFDRMRPESRGRMEVEVRDVEQTEPSVVVTVNRSHLHTCIYVDNPQPPAVPTEPPPTATPTHRKGAYPVDLFSLDQRRQGWVLLHVFGMIYMFVALAIVCDEFFVPALGVITDRLQISDDVAGATFMAAGGSAPELFTSLIGVFVSHSNVGIGTIVGSAVFNILFVIGMCAIFSREMLHLTWWPLFRDVTFYILDLVMLIVFFLDNAIWWWESALLVLGYLCYVWFMKFNTQIEGVVKRNINKHKNVVSVWTAARADKAPALSSGPVPTPAPSLAPVPTPATVPLPALTPASALVPVPAPAPDHASALVPVSALAQVPAPALIPAPDPAPDPASALAPIPAPALAPAPALDPVTALVPTPEEKTAPEPLSPKTLTVPGAQEDKQRLKVRPVLQRGGSSASLHNTSLRNTIFTLMIHTLDPLREDRDQRPQCEHAAAEPSTSHRSEEKITKQHTEVPQTSESSGDSDSSDPTSSSFDEEDDEDDEEDSAPLSLQWPESRSKQASYLCVFPIVFPLWLTLPDVRHMESRRFFAVTFLGSILWIGVFSYLMVWWAHQVGETVGISEEIMGLTVLAAGTSIPDLITSVIVARKGLGDMAVSSSVGSNIFDITVGLPVPWLLFSLLHGGEAVAVSSNGLFCAIVLLFLMLLFVLMSIALCGWRMSRGLGLTMFLLYFLFLLLSVLLENRVLICPVSI